MDSAGMLQREKKQGGGRRGGQSVRGAPWGCLPVRKNMKNQWGHNELHLESCQTLAEGSLEYWVHCENRRHLHNALHYSMCYKDNRKPTQAKLALKMPLIARVKHCTYGLLFLFMYRLMCCAINICLCIKVCKPPPTSTPDSLHVLAASLHAARFRKPLRVLFMFGVAALHPCHFCFLPVVKRAMEGPRGAKSFNGVSIWLHIRRADMQVHCIWKSDT